MIRVLTRPMTKLSWPRAKAHQQAARAASFDRYAKVMPIHSQQDWAKAKLKRQINALTERIQSGKQWISTIPSSDPRWPLWQRKLLQLIQQRNALRRECEGQQATQHPSSPWPRQPPWPAQSIRK